ncbi:PE family protein [Mycobacteroides abscessus subsp. abscessus]|uniref:WXG100 family type VII secretion target n=1 Tax=Mycobacteroides abscessus TaxID=36809 RepID=UPI00092CD5B2|nr:WXG100 family type VII secretion target [Mycobacteroides abscessus]SIC60469.1 PE family protein [Mycobacteroides abscessus subsp. abscessus]SIC92805.1 PE family protein [Mycobacteroides abscessus subsp. abscessus]SID12454.1 PE family protein [Mycobacteroides abscessus subsp. abscessus]SID16653.1 PE family protein [Mycobacteroides abscessus subsp. abscessus]SKT51643.1 PE family protein [Mycobacteroides abscessus subsp. abscessus]
MSSLDVQVGQLVASQGSFESLAATMRSTIHEAQSQVQASKGFYVGESADATQAAHMRFEEAATKANQLLDIAGSQLGEGASTYTSQDSQGASDITSTVGAIGS